MSDEKALAEKMRHIFWSYAEAAVQSMCANQALDNPRSMASAITHTVALTEGMRMCEMIALLEHATTSPELSEEQVKARSVELWNQVVKEGRERFSMATKDSKEGRKNDS